MFNRTHVVAIAVVALTLQAGAPQAAGSSTGQESTATANPFVGDWTANYAKSRLHPSFRFQKTTLHITAAGDVMTMASNLVSESGQAQRVAETFRTDGAETPGTLSSGVTLMAKYLGRHVLASVAIRNGEVYALVTYQVSTDGRTLTSRSSGTLEQVIVFDRD